MTESLLSANDLSVRFGGLLAVNKVSFDVKKGEVFTLIGPNGAGKTTVFNLISRIYTPTAGSIDFVGPKGLVKLTEQAPQDVAALGIARTFQNIELFEHASVLHNLLIGRHTHRKTSLWQDMFFTAATREEELRSREKAEEVIDFLNLQHYRDTFVAGLPYGVRKVVELARALATEPKMLLLDEVMTGLTPIEAQKGVDLVRQIRASGVTVVMVEHVMEVVMPLVDRAVVLHLGKVLAQGLPRDIVRDEAVIAAYLGDRHRAA
jgi:branched-chain amino acid transport system ATP-binding protein